ncbi:MAG: type I-D CRISPR-associated protein Cas5/Csc1 [Thermoplasmata archaeon]
MKIYDIELTILSPIQFYGIQSRKGTRTPPFIGDIALTYAMAHQLGIQNYPDPSNFEPLYKNEMKQFNFLFTVSVPISLIENNIWAPIYMKQLYRNTMQGIDYNGTNVFSGNETGSSMYKNFFFTQSLKPGYDNKFIGGFISFDEKIIPIDTLRVGNGKTGVVKLTYKESDNSSLFYINQYTVENIFEKKLPEISFKNVYYPFNPYKIMGPITKEQLKSIFY